MTLEITSAPGQEGGRMVNYRLLTVNEAQKVFSEVKKGRFDLLVALGLGEKVIRYNIAISVSSQIIRPRAVARSGGGNHRQSGTVGSDLPSDVWRVYHSREASDAITIEIPKQRNRNIKLNLV
ncbi:hypothetical protein [Trinickia dinghuensis]|uniref:hypothetical protein n=1 Tax=Trinickia dinghuensis TaxID=2291023 RepID=UPI0011C05211|nr:hypothetical protein [Trinickia dinghuensis]